jgi:hypothetical protein
MGARAGNASARAATRWLVLGGTLLTATLLGACEFIYDVPVQGGTDASVSDSALDRKGPVDVTKKKDSAGSDAEADQDSGTTADTGVRETGVEATVYHLFANSTQWSTFDTAGVNPNAVGFTGGTFDGRYVYLAPNENTVAARYDTTATFTSNGAWSTFDPKPLLDAGPAIDAGPPPDGGTIDAGVPPGGPGTFFGSIFDGKYVYLLPGAGPPAFAARFDTKGTFTSAGSWETYDLAPLAGGQAYGFGGGTFDGTYVYVVPNATSILARFDTTSSFSAPGAGWTTFDMSTLSDGGAGSTFTGAVFDGRYVYCVPGSFTSIAMRYDTHGPIDSASSWSSYDTTRLNFNAYGFAGGAFDGKYVYLVPNVNGVVVRYDTTAGAFSSSSSWAFFNSSRVKLLAKGYFGAAFDGRFIYFVPDIDPSLYYYTYTPSGLAVRYDTTQSFFAVTSWTTFDTSTLANAEGFSGAVFDGQYMYFVPYNNSSFDGIVARFDAKTPPSMPKLPDFHGSFF